MSTVFEMVGIKCHRRIDNFMRIVITINLSALKMSNEKTRRNHFVQKNGIQVETNPNGVFIDEFPRASISFEVEWNLKARKVARAIGILTLRRSQNAVILLRSILMNIR